MKRLWWMISSSPSSDLSEKEPQKGMGVSTSIDPNLKFTFSPCFEGGFRAHALHAKGVGAMILPQAKTLRKEISEPVL